MRAQGGIGRGNGALWRKPPGRSIVPSSDIRIASARIVWKPFECAASPRIAWNATGLPVTESCSLPQESVHGIGSSIFSSRAVMPSSCARRRMVAAGNAGDLARPLRRVVPHALLQQLERRLDRRAVGELERAEQERIGALGVRHAPARWSSGPTTACSAGRSRLPLRALRCARTCRIRRWRRRRSRAGRRSCSAPGSRGRTVRFR